ncbi:MAG: peptidoglycan editing factor PgeF [Steroidobacteraceae bacterium]
MSSVPRFLIPEWPAPPRVRAAFTLREGGVSRPPFDTLNVGGAQTGDDPQAVRENRARVGAALGLRAGPAWLTQVHGAGVVCLDGEVGAPRSEPPRADAVVTRDPGRVCAIQVADCLPVLLASRDGSVVGAAHGGWRGLAAGVLRVTVEALAADPASLIAWLGPAIGPGHFEVGDEVRAALEGGGAALGAAFVRNERGRWQCDLPAVARRQLGALGVGEVYGGRWCTYADAARFFSYRRDGRCGRMAALVWIAPEG